MIPWSEKDHAFTGRFRVRVAREKTAAFKRTRPVLVLQVEETCIRYPDLGSQDKAYTMKYWRDLRPTDLNIPSLTADELASTARSAA